MWTEENRGRYDRSKLRYPSDLTDEEWALIAPLIPLAKPGGNKRTVNEREIVNGLMYILSTGCQWAALPKDLPPRSTVNDYLHRWVMTARWIASTMLFMCNAGKRQGGRPVRPLRSSTARASRARKRGAFDRSVRLRCRQVAATRSVVG
jgi:transposase